MDRVRADLESAAWTLEMDAGVVPTSRAAPGPHSCKLLRTGKCLGIAVLFGLAAYTSVTMPPSTGSFFKAVRPIQTGPEGGRSKLRVHETFSAASTAPAEAVDVSVASEEVGALLQESAAAEARLEQAAMQGRASMFDAGSSAMDSEPKDLVAAVAQGTSLRPWFNSLTKYKRGSYKDAAERIRAYRAAQEEQEGQDSSFWTWFTSLTKYKRGSYTDAAERIREYRAAQVKVVLDAADMDQQLVQN